MDQENRYLIGTDIKTPLPIQTVETDKLVFVAFNITALSVTPSPSHAISLTRMPFGLSDSVGTILPKMRKLLSKSAAKMLIPQLETQRIILRGWREEDLDAYAEMCGDPEIMRYVGAGKSLSRWESWISSSPNQCATQASLSVLPAHRTPQTP